jgi:hypothetical protein
VCGIERTCSSGSDGTAFRVEDPQTASKIPPWVTQFDAASPKGAHVTGSFARYAFGFASCGAVRVLQEHQDFDLLHFVPRTHLADSFARFARRRASLMLVPHLALRATLPRLGKGLEASLHF